MKDMQGFFEDLMELAKKHGVYLEKFQVYNDHPNTRWGEVSAVAPWRVIYKLEGKHSSESYHRD